MTRGVRRPPAQIVVAHRRATREIAARKRAERRLRFFERALETTRIGITITDTDGRIVFVNQAEAAMHGWRRDELVGQDIAVFSPPDERRPLGMEELRRAGGWTRERLNLRRDGSLFPVRLFSDVVRDADGEAVGLMTTCEDITARKSDETAQVESLTALEAQLRQSQKLEAIGQLTSGISHDFKNLLCVILANGELVKSSLPPGADDTRELLDDVLEAARSGATMIEQLLGFSRKADLRVVLTDLRDVVSGTAELWRHVIREDIGIETRMAADAGAVRVDPAAIQQILINLVTNARDAMPDGGTIRVEVAPAALDASYRDTHPWVVPGRYTCVSVSDTGVGMDAQTVARAFEPFFTTKSAGKGTGLGLAMVYGLVKQHHGAIHLYSEPGSGTTVKLYFPEALEAGRPAAPPAPPRAARGGSECVLLAEDVPGLRRSTQRALERLGYTALVAADGAEALAAWREHRDRINLVITDIMMPNLGGPGLFRAVRAEGGTLPFLFSSGYSSLGVEERAGVSDVPCLVKPWSVEELARQVRAALDAVPAP